MYYITESQWQKIPADYKLEKDPEHGKKACFLCYLTPTGAGGNTLCFEDLHFKIIPDRLKDFNEMCLDCPHLEKECSGTKAQFWSGCIWKKADNETMNNFSERYNLNFRERNNL